MSQIDDEKEFNKEFSGPAHLSELDRRDFLKYMGLFSSMTLLSNCTRKAQDILPMPREFSEFSKFEYEYYTSVFPSRGFALGIKVKSHQGRPIKVEGNKLHPFSLGSTSAQAQSTIYDLYHPGRNKYFVSKGKKIKVSEFKAELDSLKKDWGHGQGVAFVFPPDHSPHLHETIQEVKKIYPESIWSALAPWKETSWINYSSSPRFIALFDEEIFQGRPDSLKLARDFMRGRRQMVKENTLNNKYSIYAYESTPTLAGAKADFKVVLSREEIWNDLCDLKNLLEGGSVSNARMIKLLEELKRNPSLVLVNKHLDPEAKNIEKKINSLIKSQVFYVDFSLPETHEQEELEKLLLAKKIHTLVFLGTNPLYWYPQWKKLTESVPHKITLSQFENDTQKVSTLIIPESHFLEAWGDLKSPDGKVSIQQPLIRPMNDTLSSVEVLNLILGKSESVLDSLKKKYQRDWEKLLETGVTDKNEVTLSGLERENFHKKSLSSDIRIKLVPDPSIGFGEFANNPVLQELPKPFSKLTWQSVFFISPEMGKDLNLRNGDVIKVIKTEHEASAPVWILEGIHPKTVLAPLGFGHEAGSFIAKKRGFNAYHFKQDEVISVAKTGKREQLASTHEYQRIQEAHSPVKQAKFPVTTTKHEIKLASLYPENPHPKAAGEKQWGMTIDLTTCIGCNSCVSSCQVENNIPFVGEDQVKKDRILHWLRIDVYEVNSQTVFQPIPCMHCEKAPCEVVCPVNATVHGKGGLNEMVYNRCVGTRYCSNNCPYKVRRFNFKAYSNVKSPWNMGFNPEVSVRERGVMEKCTYCIQLIKSSEREGEKPQTACQKSCPTEAIVFGDIKDPHDEVALNKKSALNYDLLEEEGAVPRTSYLKVINL